MIYLFSYNESFIRNLTGAILLSTLLSISNVAKGQNTKYHIEKKAELSTIDKENLLDILDSLYKKGYVDYQKIDLFGDNFLFTSCTDVNFTEALKSAKSDVFIKMKYLGKIGNQHILKYFEKNTWTVIILTEILNE